MRGRIAVAIAIALATGCSGGGRHTVDADADAGPASDADGPPTNVFETQPPPPTDARDADAGDTKSDRGVDADAGDDADARPGDAIDTVVDMSDSSTDAPAIPNLCSMSLGTVTVDGATVSGTTSGDSRNAFVSCSNNLATPGPEAVYTLKVNVAGLVEVRVDTAQVVALALRRGCADGVSEIACGTSGPAQGAVMDGGAAGAPSFDASSGSGGAAGGGGFDAAVSDAAPVADASSNDGTLPLTTVIRARLAAGTYTILVDQTFAFDPHTVYELSARSVAPAANASCATPTAISGPVTLNNQDISLATTSSVACGSTPGPALYYAVGVPSGQRLTVRATPHFGGPSWMPRLAAFTACDASTCLAQGHTSSGTTQQLDWSNNGPDWRLVLFSISSDTSTAGAMFDLVVGIANQLSTCGRPTAVVDGTVILGQDLRQSAPPDQTACNGATDHALFYAAQVLPKQTLTVSALGSSSQNVFTSPASLAIREACNSQCQGTSNPATFTNTTDDIETVIIEASSVNFGSDTTFDLHVSLPLPPAEIDVIAGQDLVTTEAGGTATFQVKLGSPPTADVTIPLASDTPTEGKASPASLVFTATNWDQPQTVTVTGVDDTVSDGARPYLVVTGAATSADPRYDGLDSPDVPVTNLDDDPGIEVVGGASLVTTEWGGQATFQVRLNHAPTATVHLPIASSDLKEGTVDVSELIFTPTDWSALKTVTLTGVDDSVVDGAKAYTITLGPSTSADPVYANLDPPDLVAHNRDDDFGTVSPRLLSGSHSCGFASHQTVVVDDFGTLYVAAPCDDGILVFTSADGGATFSGPTTIPDSTNIGNLQIASGRGGVVYLAYTSSVAGVQLTITRDGGASWSPAQTLVAAPTAGFFQGNVRVAAAGDTVLVAYGNTSGSNMPSSRLWRSTNAGRSFGTPMPVNANDVQVALRPDGQTAWLIADNVLEKSTDAGVSFTPIGTLTFDTSIATFTDTQLIAVAFSEIGVIDFSGAGGGASGADGGSDASAGGVDAGLPTPQFIFPSVNNLSDLAPVDPPGNILVLGTSPTTGALSVSRIEIATSSFTDTVTIGPPPSTSALAVLSPKVVGTVFTSGNLLLFASTTPP
ncbi:MAG TPA: sialidase family protein [Polyangia bacterium]|nr:sialidase family protein [Polyangia bacterium]